MTELFIQLNGEDHLKIIDHGKEVEWHQGKRVNKFQKKDILITLSVAQPQKGAGYLLYTYQFKKGRERDLLFVDTYSKEHLIEAIENLSRLERSGILTELKQPFGYDV